MTDYTLTPENILGDLVAPRGRRMLDSYEIFRELVSQRLAQGFQLIDLGREQSECYRQMNKWVASQTMCDSFCKMTDSGESFNEAVDIF